MTLNRSNSCSTQRKMQIAADTEIEMSRILLAEDDFEMRSLLAESLRGIGYDVVECPDGRSLVKNIDLYWTPFSPKKYIDLVISDIRMPGATGLEILAALQQFEDCPPIILITGFGNRETHELADQYGAAAMFDKPFDVNDLLAEVRDILSHKPDQISR